MTIRMEEPAQIRSAKNYVRRLQRNRKKTQDNPPPQPTTEQELQQLELAALRKIHDPFNGSTRGGDVSTKESDMNIYKDTSFTADIKRRWQQRCLWTGTRVFWYWLFWELVKLGIIIGLGVFAWGLVRG